MTKKCKVFRVILYLALIVLLLKYGYDYIIINANIPTNSMAPTLNPGDKVIINHVFYKYFGKPERFDILVFKNPEDKSMLLIKRVIGLPGDKIEIKGGILYVNDNKVDETYLNESIENGYQMFNVPEDHYLFMGDNRNHSYDSREWEKPYISRNNIIGKLVIKYSPQFIKY